MTDAGTVRFAWLARLLGRALSAYARLVAATCRISGPVTREQVVLAFWHEYNLVALVVAGRHRSDLRHASFSTQGFRGVVITTLLESSPGHVRVLPLPDQSDRAAARDFALRMATLARDGRSLVVTPDGPFGPYRVAKPGALIVARASGLPVQPWAMTVRPELRLGWRWDHQILPLPFCRIRVREGDLLRFADRERLASRLGELQNALDLVSGSTAATMPA